MNLVRGMLPTQHCRKIKYIGKLSKLKEQKFRFQFISLSILSFIENNTWVYIRSCNTRENITNAREAEAYLCHGDYCNASVCHHLAAYLAAISIFATTIHFAFPNI